jgi:hypothetical protein
VPAALHGQSLPATARQQSTLGAMGEWIRNLVLLNNANRWHSLRQIPGFWVIPKKYIVLPKKYFFHVLGCCLLGYHGWVHFGSYLLLYLHHTAQDGPSPHQATSSNTLGLVWAKRFRASLLPPSDPASQPWAAALWLTRPAWHSGADKQHDPAFVAHKQ